MHYLSELMNAYCRERSIDDGVLVSPRRTGEIISHRTTFVAVVLKIKHPEALNDINRKNPHGLVSGLSAVLGPGKSGISKLLKNARSFYKTYSGFKNEVDTLERCINAA